jgi:hypothetical protein
VLQNCADKMHKINEMPLKRLEKSFKFLEIIHVTVNAEDCIISGKHLSEVEKEG